MSGKLKNLKRTTLVFWVKVWHHLKAFWMPWLVFGCILGVSFFDIPCKMKMFLIAFSMVVFVLFLIIRPMNIIYGLIGTHGNINLFFFLFIAINVFFSWFYYNTFFCRAGVTYDANQCYVEFELFDKDSDEFEKIVTLDDTKNTLFSSDTVVKQYYCRVDYSWVLRNTILTSFMQEPTDFFSVASSHINKPQQNQETSLADWFHWFLIFHILVSWIMLGVFISLIYQKFRNT